MRDDFDASLIVMENPKAAYDDDVAGDNENNEPDGKSPTFGTPGKDGKGGEGEEKEAFVGEGVEKGPEFGKLIELTGKVAIKSVGNRSDDEDDDGGPAKGFVTNAIFDAQAIVDGDRDEERDTQEAEDGDVSGNVHRRGGREKRLVSLATLK